MTNYIVKFIDGSKSKITEDEYKKLAGRTGLVFIPSSQETLNLQSVSRIYPESQDNLGVNRNKQLEGVTPEGEVVIKRFGQWYYRDANEYQRDEQGQSILEYRGQALLPTPEEYEAEFKQLNAEQWPTKLIGKSAEVDDRLLLDRSNRTTQGFEKLLAN